MPSGLYEEFAAAYVRGMCPDAPAAASVAELLEHGRRPGPQAASLQAERDAAARACGARHAARRFALDARRHRQRARRLPLAADGRLSVAQRNRIERDERRLAHLEAVRRGGIERLCTMHADAADLPFADGEFDAVTALEVLEHQHDPLPLAREAVRVAARFVIASVPSKADDNPEHVQLFTGESLSALLLQAGAHSVKIEHVLNHIVAIARVG